MYCKEITAEQAAGIRESHKKPQTEEFAKDYIISEIVYAATGGWEYVTINTSSIKGMSKDEIITWLKELGYKIKDAGYGLIDVEWGVYNIK